MKILDKANIALFQKVEHQLTKMVETETLVVEILPDLESIKKDFEAMMKFWEEYQGAGIENRFILYHYSKNAAAIIQKGIDQFNSAKLIKKNPEVASNILNILPSLSNAYEELLDIDIERLKSEELFDIFSERTRDLREIAQSEGLLPSLESCVQKLGATAFEKGLREFSDEVYSALHVESEENDD